jgi:hypothetical protein
LSDNSIRLCAFLRGQLSIRTQMAKWQMLKEYTRVNYTLDSVRERLEPLQGLLQLL